MRAGDVRPDRQCGFTFVALVVALAIFGVGLAQIGPLLADQAQREREVELIRIGDEVVHAIRAYHLATPGPVKRLPGDWSDLLEDRRTVQLRRHLRRLPRDPMTGTQEWTIVRDASGSMLGIRSRSDKRPFRAPTVEADGKPIPTGERYSEWIFAYEPTVIR
jgi:type II secretory pathway pseudopilin PulG